MLILIASKSIYFTIYYRNSKDLIFLLTSSSDMFKSQLDMWRGIDHLDGLAQYCSNSIADALELPQSCANSSICIYKAEPHKNISNWSINWLKKFGYLVSGFTIHCLTVY